MKWFICLVVSFLLMGCTQVPGYKITTNLPEQHDVVAYKFTTDYHDYILFSIHSNWVGVVHDPDCMCQIKTK